MTSFAIRLACGLVILSVATTGAASQAVPRRDLPRPSREVAEAFTFVSSARVLRDGRLLVADGADVQLSIVDFTTGLRTPLGRKGQGPGEYTNPMTVFEIGGDTVFVLDVTGTASRLVGFLPNGRPGPVRGVTLGPTGGDSANLTTPMSMDARGRLFGAALRVQVSAPVSSAGVARVRSEADDSSTLVWLDPRAENARRVPVARLKHTPTGGSQTQQAGATLTMTLPFNGLTAIDSWDVFRDGSIAIVRGSDFRIERFNPDGARAGATTVPYDRIRVTESDRKALLDTARRRISEQPWVKRMTPPGGTFVVDFTPPAEWPTEYPPTAASARAAPDGRLWVRRLAPPSIAGEQWDVIDPAGRVVARWQLPARTALVAVGDGAVFTVRTDADDLRYVQRVELPRF